MYETLLHTMLETSSDIVVCNYQVERENFQETALIPKFPAIMRYTAEEALKMLLTEKPFIRNAVWNKLFQRHIIANLQFPEGKIFEDNLWTPQAIGVTNSIIAIDVPLYHYLNRSDSLSHNVHNLYHSLYDMFEMRKLRIQYIHDYFPSLEDLAITQYQTFCCNKYLQISLKNRQFDVDGSIRQMIHDNFCNWSWSKNLMFGAYKEGIRCLTFRYCPKAFPLIHDTHNKLRNIWNKVK